MLAMNDETFESICSEFYCGDENVFDLRNKVFQKLKYISCFREVNSHQGWNFITENISIDRLYRKSIIDCHDKIIEEINRPSQNDYNLEKQSIVNNHYHSVLDLKLITRGHDFSELFKVICNTSGIESEIKSKQVESALRTSFTKESFKRTNLFKSLLEYEKSYGLNFLVS